ncbi:hypothetical protein M9Y10_002380 [Tritrichomonas musculus]|uniref:Intimal thickness related receptor IRP domain-containing protein n=1 Tax=Tritrichomonas musculus TaxID=1915356 RepID=A0ABR2LA07_9EUKA
MWLLISFISSFSSTQNIESQTLITSLKDFGFEKNGTFNFRLYSKSRFRTEIYLIPDFKYSMLDFSNNACQNYCEFFERNLLRFSSSLFFYSQEEYFINWSSHTNKSEVLIPVITNCQKKSITVMYTFRNPKTYLDYREKMLPLFYILVCLLATTLTVFWILNSIIHPHFLVHLHVLFSISTALIAISSYYKADVWISRTIIDSISPKNRTISFLIELASIAFLFSVNACAASGFCIYYEDLKFAILNFLRIFILLISILITKELIDTITFSWIYFSLALLVLIMGYSYAEFIAQSIQNAIYLQMELGDRFAHYSNKFELIINFSSDLLMYLFSIFITTSYLLFSSFHKSVGIFIQEVFIFTLIFMDIHYFFYKNEYNGPNEYIEESPPTESTLTYLHDPGTTDFVFVSHIID